MEAVSEPGVGERRAQLILLVRAFEESDPEGLILPLRERTKATRRALMVTGLSGESGESATAWKIRSGEAVLRRARLLFDSLIRRHPALQRILRLAQLGSSTAPLALGLALLAGLLTNALGFQRQVNLLSFPLIGLLAWNLAIYVAMAVAPLLRRRRAVHACSNFLCGMFFKGAIWRRIHSSRITEGGTSPESRIIIKGVMRFGAMWHRLAGDLLAARVRRILHVGAVVMIAGAVIGMYVRGFAFEYRATWESTWLDAPQMQRLLGLILGPAAWVMGVDIPDVASLRGPEGSGDAAIWIHLYAVTAFLIVGLPRAGLALFEGWRCLRFARRLQVDHGESYYRRLFTAWRGATRFVEIVPYSYTPRPGATAALKTLLFDYFGARADLHLTGPLPYGGDAGAVFGVSPATWQPSDDADGVDREFCFVVVFNLAQSPESEVHGAFLEELTTRIDTRHTRMLVVLDVSRYRDGIGEGERVRQRVDAWSRVVHDTGLVALPIDLERPVSPAGVAGERTKDGASEDLMGAIRAALWPDRNAVQAT
jgi:hypothetical protein